MNFIIIESTW